MSGPGRAGAAGARRKATAATRVGRWYATGPDRPFKLGDPAFAIHVVVSDRADVPGCVTVRNPAGQCFPVAATLVDDISAPAGEQAGTPPAPPTENGEPSP